MFLHSSSKADTDMEIMEMTKSIKMVSKTKLNHSHVRVIRIFDNHRSSMA